jgi:transcription termination/antitermination protein NusG
MADTGNKWYVLKAVSGKEAKVKEYIEAEMKHNDLLAANVSQVLIPLEKHASVRNGKRVVKEKVSLPGYVFVEARLKGDVAHTLPYQYHGEANLRYHLPHPQREPYGTSQHQ